MIKFDEQKQIDSVNGALALRPQIEELIDRLLAEGVKNLCWLGIGGTWASCMQVVCYLKEHTDMDTFATNAAEYCTTGDKRVGAGTLVVLSSVTGTTTEIVDAVRLAQSHGAKVLGFLRRQGNFPDYDTYYAQMDAYLAKDLVEIEKIADPFAEDFARKHLEDKLHYFVGAGCLYGATYSYAMCYWEEMHWIRTKSIHSAEFFHGMLEIVDKDTPVTVFVGEDSQRPLSERVVPGPACGEVPAADLRELHHYRHP